MGKVEQRLHFGECRDLNETHRVSYLVPVLSEDGSSSVAYERCVLVAVPEDVTPGSGGVVASTYLHFPGTLQEGDIDLGDGPRKRLVESAGELNCTKFHFKIAAVGGLPAIDTRGRGVDGGKARWWTDLQGLQRLLENNKFTGPMGLHDLRQYDPAYVQRFRCVLAHLSNLAVARDSEEVQDILYSDIVQTVHWP